MQRVRRKLAVVGFAMAAALSLSACQNDPNQAISMGGFHLAVQDVEKAADVTEANVGKLIADLKAQGQPVNEEPIRGDVRSNIVELNAFIEVARRYAQEKRVNVPSPDYATIAEQIQLPENDPLTRLYAQAEALRTALEGVVAPAKPDDEELKELYTSYARQAVQAGQTPSITFDQFRQQLSANEVFLRNLGIRNELVAAAERYGLVVNPRYAPVSYALQTVQTDVGPFELVAVPLGDQGTGAVRDLG